MANFREVPTPNFEYDVQRLVKTYEKALRDVQAELNSLFLSDFQRAQIVAVEENIALILKDLRVYGDEWAKVAITQSAMTGVASTIFALGLTATIEEATQIAKFNTMNKRLVDAIIADTQADLLAVTNNVSRKTRAAVRQVTADVLRSKTASGINGTQSLTQAITKELRKKLGESADTAIVDSAGRKWKLKNYSEMLVRAKMMEAHREATLNEAISNEAYYGVISRHGAKDKCSLWESKIIKLVREAPGDFVYIGDIPRYELWHPSCRHTLTALKNIDFLPDRIKKVNEIE